MLAATLVAILTPVLIAIVLKLVILKWYHPADPGEVMSVEVYYSTANRIAGYIVLCIIPFVTGAFLLYQQPGLASVFMFTVFTLFSFAFYAQLSCRVRFDRPAFVVMVSAVCN